MAVAERTSATAWRPGVPPAEPEKPYDDRMRGTLFGHMLHLPELKLPAPEEPSSRELTIVDQSAPTSQALEVYQPTRREWSRESGRDGRRPGSRRRPRRFRGRTATAASPSKSTPGRTTRCFSGSGSPRRRSPPSSAPPSSGCTPARRNPSCRRDPRRQHLVAAPAAGRSRRRAGAAPAPARRPPPPRAAVDTPAEPVGGEAAARSGAPGDRARPERGGSAGHAAAAGRGCSPRTPPFQPSLRPRDAPPKPRSGKRALPRGRPGRHARAQHRIAPA